MRILILVHGYPPRYNAGSEVYTQTIARRLAQAHEVMVFTRFEDSSLPPYTVIEEVDFGAEKAPVRLQLVNMAGFRERFVHEAVEQRFRSCLASFKPEVVHVQHLNHLSIRLVEVAKAEGLAVAYTLHDFWLQCPRGQFIRTQNEAAGEMLPLCDRQEDATCAAQCYQRSSTGDPAMRERDLAYHQDWVATRMAYVRKLVDSVDCFLAPSRHLMDRFRRDLKVPRSKVRLLDYGFDRARLAGRIRKPNNEPVFVFGYIGTHVAAKGVALLIDAFANLGGCSRLKIWGRDNAETTPGLRRRVESLPPAISSRIEWMGEYANTSIVSAVFDHVDAIVVPSVWLENAPLVIHEAQQAGVPVVTADVGGMAEFVRDGENGALFRHRDIGDLTRALYDIAADPARAARMGRRGYLYSDDGQIPSVDDHVAALEEIYDQIAHPRPKADSANALPFRLTFDTNPDQCNLTCVMCEEHSPHSLRQIERKACGLPPRQMKIETFEAVMRELEKHPPEEIIPSTMGEPLLYRDFDRIVAACRRHGTKLNLTTNGTFPRRGPRNWGRILLPITSDVKISFNSMRREIQEAMMPGISFDEMIANISEFVRVRDHLAGTGQHRASITLQATFMERNVEGLPEVVRFAAGLGIDRVKGHQLWAHFEQIKADDMRRSQESRRRWNEIVAECHRTADTHRRPDGSKVRLENFTPLEEAAASGVPPDYECPFLGREAWVNSAGRFDPCCAPDALRKSLGSFGDVTENGLLEIWNSPKYRELLGRYRDMPLCQNCVMRRPTLAAGRSIHE